MGELQFIGIPTEITRAYQQGKLDANGQAPERHSEGGGPCRHCLQPIAQNDERLTLAYRPFKQLNAYAETGPIFLHARACAEYTDTSNIPTMYTHSKDALLIVRGYSKDDRIDYSSARVIAAVDLYPTCISLFKNAAVKYLHIRLAVTNCFQFKVERSL